MSENIERNSNKTFNKREWRRRKYSNKYKVEQWQEHRRKAALHRYYKELRKTASHSSSTEKPLSASSADVNTERIPRLSAYQEAQKEYKRKQEEKAEKIKEAQKKREEKSQALARYRANKAEMFKKLSKKTKKGQPVMKGRMEILLQKLQGDVQS